MTLLNESYLEGKKFLFIAEDHFNKLTSAEKTKVITKANAGLLPMFLPKRDWARKITKKEIISRLMADPTSVDYLSDLYSIDLESPSIYLARFLEEMEKVELPVEVARTPYDAIEKAIKEYGIEFKSTNFKVREVNRDTTTTYSLFKRVWPDVSEFINDESRNKLVIQNVKPYFYNRYDLILTREGNDIKVQVGCATFPIIVLEAIAWHLGV